MAATVDELRTKLEQYLTAAKIAFTQRDGRFSTRRGSSAVFIKPSAWQGDHTIAELIAPVLQDVAATPELLKALNEQNATLYFGTVYHRDNGIWISHTLLGDHIDAPELIAALGMVAALADKLDDELKKTFGGRRYNES